MNGFVGRFGLVCPNDESNEQVQNTLTNENGSCCLGVACEVYIKNGGELKRVVQENGRVCYDEEKDLLPRTVQNWLGLKSNDGAMQDVVDIEVDDPYNERETISRRVVSLAEANDEGADFKQIVELIKQNERGLFSK